MTMWCRPSGANLLQQYQRNRLRKKAAQRSMDQLMSAKQLVGATPRSSERHILNFLDDCIADTAAPLSTIAAPVAFSSSDSTSGGGGGGGGGSADASADGNAAGGGRQGAAGVSASFGGRQRGRTGTGDSAPRKSDSERSGGGSGSKKGSQKGGRLAAINKKRSSRQKSMRDLALKDLPSP